MSRSAWSQSIQIGKPSTWACTVWSLPSGLTLMTSPSIQSQNQRRPSCQRGDSPKATSSTTNRGFAVTRVRLANRTVAPERHRCRAREHQARRFDLTEGDDKAEANLYDSGQTRSALVAKSMNSSASICTRCSATLSAGHETTKVNGPGGGSGHTQ